MAHVCDGLEALQAVHRARLEPGVQPSFADSLDLDGALQPVYGRQRRWDYLLGHAPTRTVVGLEPHAARDDQVTTVIGKRRAALDQLQAHLRGGARVAAWFWVAPSKVQFASIERARLRLYQAGISFVGTALRARHLPTSGGPGPRHALRRRPRRARGARRRRP